MEENINDVGQRRINAVGTIMRRWDRVLVKTLFNE